MTQLFESAVDFVELFGLSFNFVYLFRDFAKFR